MLARIRVGGLAAAIACGVPWVAAAQEHTAVGMVAAVGFSVIGVLFVLAIVTLSLRAEERRDRRRMELIDHYLEKGREVPRELLQPKYDGRTPAERRQHSFRRALVQLCWAAGIAVLFFFLFPGNSRAVVWSLPFMFLAAGHFLNGVFLSGDPEQGKGDKAK